MNDTLTKTLLTQEVEREGEGRRSRGDDLYSRMADEIAETVTTGKARLCTLPEELPLIHWQSYIRYYLKKKNLKLVYRKHDDVSVRAWAEPVVKKVSPK